MTDMRLQNRYFGIVTQVLNVFIRLHEMKTDQLCAGFLQTLGVAATITISIVDVVLLIRVWVLYDRSKALLRLFSALIIVEAAAMTFVEVMTVKSLEPYLHVGPILPGCYSLIVPKYFAFYPIPPLAITLSMFLLTAWRCGKTLYGYRHTTMPVISLFLRDGVFWFLGVFAVGFSQTMICYLARATLTEVMIGPALAVYTIIASRALLNIKGILANKHAPNVGTTVSTGVELDTIQFHTDRTVD
ncbi:hypothetical protein BDN72DRAFT_838110 [Pluteus cervinus]|uniref:Uncharacterized protein n=1 Tax=Pluteus cervinus TaxID=181527 RepID=A0ACD3AZI5_9AGAR|nr:hypothetical protein BDN72DRAFT_838110 [Pluteus cervinus]